MKRLSSSSLGLFSFLVLCGGCSKSAEPPTTADGAPSAGSATAEAGHTHGSGPNGGVVFDLGAHHAEFTVDHDQQQVTVLVLDSAAKSPLPVAATELTAIINATKTAEGLEVPEMTISLKPADAANGKASIFVGSHAGVGKVADFGGTITGEIDGKPAQGTFQE